MNKEIEKPQGRERALRYGLEIDRVPLPLKSLTIEAASRWAELPADPAERDPHLREEVADKAGLMRLYLLAFPAVFLLGGTVRAIVPVLPQGRLSCTMKAMEVQLTPDQKAFVRQAIESGRLRREEDAVQEALALWEDRERTRAEILAAVDRAEASLARGDGRITTQQSMLDLAEEVKQRGRARLAAEQPPVR